MSWEQKTDGRAPQMQATEGVLRHPDGSVDIAAYAKRAQRVRAAAIATSMRRMGQFLRATLVGFVLGRFPGKSGPDLAKDLLSTER